MHSAVRRAGDRARSATQVPDATVTLGEGAAGSVLRAMDGLVRRRGVPLGACRAATVVVTVLGAAGVGGCGSGTTHTRTRGSQSTAIAATPLAPSVATAASGVCRRKDRPIQSWVLDLANEGPRALGPGDVAGLRAARSALHAESRLLARTLKGTAVGRINALLNDVAAESQAAGDQFSPGAQAEMIKALHQRILDADKLALAACTGVARGAYVRATAPPPATQ
jgi:hypothetical protein